MKKVFAAVLVMIFVFAAIASATVIKLPDPAFDGTMSLERALYLRRSIRDYTDQPLTLQQLAQLLWATYGISEPEQKLRTAPSGRRAYPLEVFVMVSENGVVGLEAGVYQYDAIEHSLKQILKGDVRAQLARTGSAAIGVAPISVIIAADMEKAAQVLGNPDVAPKYVYLEVGHAAQNLYLQATALGLGCVVTAGFRAEQAQAVLKIPEKYTLIYITPVGYPKQ
ncbi:SagB/ThcOx family dehydrogenase [Pseudothermotoga thermarum]|uniref:SagB-type dehydrogenase domain protein n=1 Tax=Pseudothermotoga thermarum DSM 5069 TaxID=688269 RepID=F7YUT1_9THEM|nr:SagB/ThcOx family dehydrogenase [Pseudothermotoga thermarum]AEH50270.1 SagB-type dehydrogenase domain protein [Pseudothermotoga thermarum DSM 5069]